MYPVIFEVGDFVVTSFGLMLALSFLAAAKVAQIELRRKGYDGDIAWTLVLGAMIGGIAGAKVYYAFLNWPLLAADPIGTLFSRGGLVWYGGLIGGALGVTLLVRRHRLPFWEVADISALAIPVAYMIGRVGCFLVGDDYGRPTESWIGIAFPNGQPPSTAGNLRDHFGAEVPAGIPDAAVLTVHPTQLYEIGLTGLIFAFLWTQRKHAHRPGWLFALYLVLAGLERGVVEFFRVKDDRFLGSFTLAQLISVALIVIGIALVRARRERGVADVAHPVGT